MKTPSTSSLAALGAFALAPFVCPASSLMTATPFADGEGERFNLWPIAYYRRPALSVAWPLFSASDDHIALRPLYSQHRQLGANDPYDEYNVLWPICQFDRLHGCNRILPVCWSQDEFAVYPLVWDTHHSIGVLPFVFGQDRRWMSILPLFYCTLDGSRTASTLFPLYYYSSKDGDRTFWALCGLFGYRWPGHGDMTSNWLLPLYAMHDGDFYSLPCSRLRGKDGDTLDLYLLGLGGRETDSRGRALRSWTFPFHFQDHDVFVSPLYGRTAESDWLLPLYYRDKQWFSTLAYSFKSDPDTGGRSFILPWLLSGFGWSERDASGHVSLLAGFAGMKSDAQGRWTNDWLVPLYSRESNGDFLSLPYGHVERGPEQTNTWWATPLVGTRSGRMTGSWLFPLFDWREDRTLGEKLSCLDGRAIPPSITFSDETVSNAQGEKSVRKLQHGSLKAEDEQRFLLLANRERQLADFYSKKDNQYRCTYRQKSGNGLVTEVSEHRKVVFDAETRDKVEDVTTTEASLLLFLYKSHETRDALSGSRTSRRQVLWKLWDRQEKDGKVSLDVFPGFCHDSQPDGLTRTSLLWRLFRYEGGRPGEDSKLDLLFVPIWR